MKVERADRMKGVEMSRIRATLTKCNEMKRAGIDLAMFTVGQPDFDTPQYIKDACEASIEAVGVVWVVVLLSVVAVTAILFHISDSTSCTPVHTHIRASNPCVFHPAFYRLYTATVILLCRILHTFRTLQFQS